MCPQCSNHSIRSSPSWDLCNKVSHSRLSKRHKTLSWIMSVAGTESIVFFTAYTVISDYNSGGLCITTTGPPIHISPELSITKPADTNPTAFESSVTALFYDYLGFSTCSGNDKSVRIVTPIPLIPVGSDSGTPLVEVATGTFTPLSASTGDPFPSTTLVSSASNITSSSPTASSAAGSISSAFTTKDKAATGVVIPIVAIISVVLGILFYLRRRRKRSGSGKDTHGSEEETQPYLQQKAELEAEEKRRLELEAVEVRYEMDGGDHVNEMHGSHVRNEIDTVVRPQMPSLKETQELRGEECSKELDASSRPHSGTVS